MSGPRFTIALALLILAHGAVLPEDLGAEIVEVGGLVDLQGRSTGAFPESHPGPVVLLFTRTDCPISNRYAPEVRRLHSRFAPRGVLFRLVYSDPSETAPAIERHLVDYDYPLAAVRDVEQQLARLVGATVTPEAAVFDAGRKLVYRGRIDDRFVDFGTTRERAGSHDLARALEAMLAGEPVDTPRTRAVGCFIPNIQRLSREAGDAP